MASRAHIMRPDPKKSRNSSKPKPNRLALAAKVRAARAVLGWSQTELARRVGLTQRSVYLLERSAVQVRESTATALEAEFRRVGLGFTDLLEGGFTMDVPGRVLSKSRPVKRKTSSRSRRQQS
ncbi:MAG: helix-turn-helix domain-containing protein [Xanthobacteraceae bacterium]